MIESGQQASLDALENEWGFDGSTYEEAVAVVVVVVVIIIIIIVVW